MCGIFGAIHLKGLFDRADFDQFVRLTDLVRYRGPDDSGYQALNLQQSHAADPESFDVFLGNRRLSILDLSPAGHQPMTDGKGRWITFNGEIFNFVELRKELEARGHRFLTGTDTEVILHIYDEYGESGFEKLNGMWAFAIVDVGQRRVVLSRDRFSIKPFYLLRLARGQLYFASEIKQLLPLLPERELNREVMATFLSQGLLNHSSETFFRGITKVAPKTNLVISLPTGTIVERRYWDYSLESPPSSKDPTEEFRELLLDSTRIRLRSDVRVGLLLSGGLDSSALAVALVQLAEGGLETYSIISTDPGLSEERYVDAMRQTFHLRNHKVIFQLQDALAGLRPALYHGDEPFGSLSVIAQYKILDTVKKETDVVVLLSGQGGDEVLLGYLKFYFFYLRQLVEQRRFGKACTEFVLSLLRRTAVRQFKISRAKRYLPYRIGKNYSFIRIRGTEEPVWNGKDMRLRQIADLDRYSLPTLTHYEDRNAMAHSLEIRHPFLDHRLVNFVLNLPVELKLHRGWTKRILRQSFPELPANIRWRRDKQTFFTPEDGWLRTELSEFIHKTFTKSLLDEMGILDERSFLKVYEGFQNGKRTILGADISRTLIAEVWGREVLQEKVESLPAPEFLCQAATGSFKQSDGKSTRG